MRIDSCRLYNGGDGDNTVDSLLAGGVTGADACCYEVHCETVQHPLAHRYKRATVSERNGPTEEGLLSATISNTRVSVPRRDTIWQFVQDYSLKNSTEFDAWHAVLLQSAQSEQCLRISCMPVMRQRVE